MAEEVVQTIRLPSGVAAEAERAAARQGLTLDAFMEAAVAEKVAAAKSDAFFAERRGRVDWGAFERFMNRTDAGELVPGDELPEGYVRKPFRRPGA